MSTIQVERNSVGGGRIRTCGRGTKAHCLAAWLRPKDEYRMRITCGLGCAACCVSYTTNVVTRGTFQKNG